MKLSVKSALITSLTVVAAASAILFAATALMRDELHGAIQRQLAARLKLETERLHANLDGVAADALPIAQSPSLTAFLDLRCPAREREAARTALDAELAAVAGSHATYFQIRFIDETGHERARVDRRHGKVIVVAKGELQDKSTRDYVRHMLGLAPGQVYVSPLDLNREHGAIERPFVPTLRIAVPVFDDTGARRGGVVINLDAGQVLPPRRIGAARFLVANEDGYFLRHPDPEKEFGFDLGKRITIETESAAAADRFRLGYNGVVEIERGLTGPEPELILFSRFQYDPSNPDRFWRIMAAEPSAIAYAPIDALNRRLVYLVIAVAAVACFIGWIAAYGVVKPIRAMVATAQRITDGDLDAAVDVSGSGEVSLLGTAFNTMTRRLNSLIRDEQLARMNLAQSNEELRRSNEELEQFAFAASHDLRTPLRAISALREWIATDLAATKSISEDVQEHLEGMGKQVDRMSRLLSDLLEYARIGKSDVKVRRFDPAEAVHHTLALLQVPPTFTVDVAFERRTISGAPVEFELVVRNLVDNAVKHHDRSTGTIRVSGTYRREKFILEVADDGPGIPTAYHERVLRPFSVLRPRDDCEGSGLGLALVNKIVQRWGGSLEIRSADGKRGTTFRITMPIAQLKIVQTDDGAAPVPPPARRAESVAG